MNQPVHNEEFLFFWYLDIALILVLVPLTPYTFYRAWKARRFNKKLNFCRCVTCHVQRKNSKKKQVKSFKKGVTCRWVSSLIVGWLVILLISYMLFGFLDERQWSELDPFYNPYTVLGLKQDATLKEVKSTYRRLSLQYHPDKAKPGTEKQSEQKFIEIADAYKTLTDQLTGKSNDDLDPSKGQPLEIRVGFLPYLAEEMNENIVLGIYGLVFGLVLPFYTARWWYKKRQNNRDKILYATMRVFAKELKEFDDFNALIKVLSGAHEFQVNIPVRRSDAELLRAIDTAIAEEMENRFGQKFERDDAKISGYRRKARTLLYAYLLRIDLGSKFKASKIRKLQQDQQYIVEKSMYLLQGLLQVAIVKQWLGVASRLMDLQPHLLQATYPGEAPVKQLPHITTQLLRRYNRSNKKHIRSVQQLLALPEDERKAFLRPLNDQEYLDVIDVANRIPKLNVAKALFKVVGDNIITTNAVVTFALKLINGEVPEKQDGDSDIDDDELLDEDKLIKKAEALNGTLPFAHTPYYPGEKKPYWWIFLGDPKVNRILVPPKKVTDITNERMFQFSFPGPANPGVYTFCLYIKSDTYLGTDIVQDIRFEVRDPKELPAEDEVDDSISEPEEDSIAGQMRLLREQGLASALAGGSKQQQQPHDDDSDSDSDSDEE